MKTVEFLPTDGETYIRLEEPVQKSDDPPLSDPNARNKLKLMIHRYSDSRSTAAGNPEENIKDSTILKDNKKDYIDEINERALVMIKAGYKNNIIKTRLHLKSSQIAWIKRKLKYKPEVTNINGRPPIIKRQYLDFLEAHLSNRRNRFTSLYKMKFYLCQRFNLDPSSISTRTIGKMVKICNFFKKPCIVQYYEETPKR
jgi:hypothetical protein